MARFIRLTELSKTKVKVNVEHIVFIRDMQSDELLKGKPEWRYTNVQTTRDLLSVVETEEEIFNLINKAK